MKIIIQLSSNKCASSTLNKENKKIYRNYYKYFLDIQTRWNDNDMYGHVNNVIYYSYFDTIINEYEIKFAKLNPRNNLNNEYKVFCVSSSCKYLAPLQYPQIVEAGLCIEKIGYSSIVYNVGIFIKDEDENITARAIGDFVHVFVDQKTNKKTSVPKHLRDALQKIMADNN